MNRVNYFGRPTILLIAIWGVAWTNTGRAQMAPEDRTLSTMWQHGLADTALQVAHARLLQSTNSADKAKWSIRLMECHAQAALHSPLQADEHWRAAVEVEQQFSKAFPEHARLPWLAWQATRCKLLEAQSNLARYLAAPANTNLRESSLELVREILRQTEILSEDIQRRQPRAARQGLTNESEAPVEELHKLAVDVALLECEALLVRVKLYPVGSPDRVAAATDIDTRASTVISRSAEVWSAHEQLKIAKAIAQLELGNDSDALAQLEQLARDASNPQVRVRAAVTAIERLADERAISRAQPLLAYLADATRETATEAQLGLAKLQLSLAELNSLPQELRQSKLAILLNDSKQIGEKYGDYWRNRAEALLVGSLPRTPDAGASEAGSNNNVAKDLMLVEIRQLLASDRQADAIGRLLQFRDHEAAAGRGEVAIQFAAQAAALLQKQEKWQDAIAALDPLLFDFATSAKAAEAHRLVIASHTQLLRTAPKNPEFISAYESALTKHLITWPNSTTTDEPELWLMTWLSAQSRYAELLNTLQSRIALMTQSSQARPSINHWMEIALKLSDDSERTDRLQQFVEMTERIDLPEIREAARAAKLFVDAVAEWPITSKRKELTAFAMKLSVEANNSLDANYLLAVQLLDAVRSQDAAAAKPLWTRWQPELLPTTLRVAWSVAMVEALDELPAGEPLLWLVNFKMDRTWIDELRVSTAPTSQALAHRLQAWMFDANAGLDALTALTAQRPRDGVLQMQLANALAASGSDRLPESTRLAKQIAASSPSASELNLSARWRLCKNQVLAGDLEAAKQSATLLFATQPLPASIWKERFETLSKSLD